MKIYIRATGNISPQKTFGHPSFPQELTKQTGNRLACMEPDYKDLIDVRLIRRMSRIIKMGVAAAMECLQEAGEINPGAIITGTAYGCLEDTGLFLTKMIENNEELLTPTAFIQSTHNTVGAQVALMLSCHRYNNTFVHRGFSFESAVLDGLMLLLDREAENVLVGSVDEITNISHTILSRFGIYKRTGDSSNLFTGPASRGTLAGEGAAFFLLAGEPSSTDYGCLDAITTFYKPQNTEEIEDQISLFLSSKQIVMDEVDLIILGRNGDNRTDQVYDLLTHSIFTGKEVVNYKHLCGEYPTSISFAMWLAAHILKTSAFPFVTKCTKKQEKPVKRILIYNHYQNIHHSLVLLSAC